jgi:anaerobic ribonucleoside-triphosphate reductase
MSLDQLIPKVLRKKGDSVIEQDFDMKLIIVSLKRETGLSDEQIYEVLKRFFRLMIPMGLSKLTAPMIREICCTAILQVGSESDRYKYTRVGMPYYDAKKIIDDNEKEDADKRIIEHFYFEFNELTKLIDVKGK